MLVSFSQISQAEHLPIRTYTSADGLGSSFVDYMFRDSRGFMWFCTRDGLSRFDGSQFVTYRLGNQTSAPGIEFITETHDGTYWVTTSGGMFKFTSQTLSRPQSSPDGRQFLNAEFVGSWRGSIFEDSSGGVFFINDSVYGIIQKDGKYELKQFPLGLNFPTGGRPILLYNVFELPDHTLWIITNFGAVQKFQDGHVILYQHDAGLRGGVVSMAVSNDNLIWAAWGKDIFIIKPKPQEQWPAFEHLLRQPLEPNLTWEIDLDQDVPLPQAPGEIVRLTRRDLNAATMRLKKTSDGHMWIASNDELLEFDGRRFSTYTKSQGLPTGITSMEEDSAGTLWIGGHTGLSRLGRKGLVSYGQADGLNSQTTYAINEAIDGTLSVANGRFYISTFDGKRFVTERPGIDPNSVALWTSRYAFRSSANEWWVLTSTKLYRFKANNLHSPIQTYDKTNGFPFNQMYQIFEDSHGDLWLSQQPDNPDGRGLYRMKRGEDSFERFGEADGFPSRRSASAFVEDKHGNLWMGFYEGGLARFRNGHFDAFTATEGPLAAVVTDLLVDQKGRLWFSNVITGLGRIDDTEAEVPTITSFTTAQGLSSNNARTIVDDRFGNIYVGTVRGVDKIGLDSRTIKHYSVNDGLAGDFVVDSHRDHNGDIWFGTMSGLSRLTPTVQDTQERPPIFVGRLRIAGEEQPVSELGDITIQKGDLSHTRNNLQIEFFGLSFRPGDSLRYQFTLEGADSEWSAPTELRTVTYANLRPGSYRFLVRAINSEGLTSVAPAVISFRILQPIWLRWWFILLVVGILFALGYFFYKYRIARLREVNAALAEAKRAEEELGRAREERIKELESVRTRIATDLHDDIGASLTQIAILSEVARQQNLKGNGGAQAPLKSIATVSNELVETMSDIVWAINPQRDHLHDLTQRMRRFASDLLSAKNISFVFEAPAFAPDIPLGANPRREVFLIFKESLTNIVKHAEATHVVITFNFSREILTLRIADNGKGFEPARLSESLFASEKGGHGIFSMKKRAAEMQGEVEITSQPGHGAVIEFHLPLASVVRG
jgi:signal transduction histidine kinase/ligand-binding sensor domain-containing protein